MHLPTDLDVKTFADSYRLRPDNWRWAIEEVAAAAGLAVTSLHPFGDGSNLIAAIDERHVVKIFPPFHRHQWESEHRVLAHLAGRLALPVPHLHGVGERDDGWTWVVLTRLPGVLLEEVWSTFERPVRAAILRAIGETMHEVHAIAPGPVASLPPNWDTFIAEQAARAEARHRRLNAPDWLFRDLPDLLATTPLPTGPHVILTGEYTPFNLLAEPDLTGWHLSGMIDFGDAMVGPPEYDLLGPSVFLCGGDPLLVHALFDGYGRPLDPVLRRQLMLLQVLHRYSHFAAQLRLPGWRDAGSLEALAQRLWPER